MVKLNKVRERFVYLAPAVQAGWDDESNMHDFQILKILGKGSFGIVRKVKHKKTNKVYAIKELDKKEIKDRNMVEQVRTEIRVMYSLNHQNIIKLYSHFEDDIAIYLIMECAEKGQLYQMMLGLPSKKLSEEEVAKIVHQVVQALRYMHQRGIVHRDIKPQNILLDAQGNAKLADFGWSSFLSPASKRTTYCGTLDYLAPQMLDKQHKHDCTVDLWAIGVLIFELCTGMSPFSAQFAKLTKVPNQAENIVKSNIKEGMYTMPNYLSNTCKDIIQHLLVKDPSKRLTSTAIINHSWMKGHYLPDEKRPNWSEQLRNEFKDVLDCPVESKSKGAFSKEEIYQLSRPQSIINQQKIKHKQIQKSQSYCGFNKPHNQMDNHSEHGGFKHHPLHHPLTKILSNSYSCESHGQSPQAANLATIKQLRQLLHKSQQEVARLKNDKHVECQKRYEQLQNSYLTLRKKFDSQFMRLVESESKIRQLQTQLAKTQKN